jgi:hypothetical protein
MVARRFRTFLNRNTRDARRWCQVLKSALQARIDRVVIGACWALLFRLRPFFVAARASFIDETIDR